MKYKVLKSFPLDLGLETVDTKVGDEFIPKQTHMPPAEVEQLVRDGAIELIVPPLTKAQKAEKKADDKAEAEAEKAAEKAEKAAEKKR